jgi:catechol 2,3-dioxygenase-like lactoylglutathione lyase family enzyme
MATFLHTMVRITDPEKSRAFYEALGFRFSRDMDIVRNGEREATNTSTRSATPRTSSS